MNSIKVLLADDHEVVRGGFRRLFDSTADIDVVGEAASGEQAYSAYLEHQPTVVVMDISMPGCGGLDASRRMLARDSDARILVFSVHENELFLNRALELGVLGYISKRSASRVMVDAVRQVAQGKVYIGQEMLPLLIKRQRTDEHQRVAELTSREFDVFRLRAEGKSVNDIAALLNVSPKTVGHHSTSVKQKLSVGNSAELTRLAIRLGLVSP